MRAPGRSPGRLPQQPAAPGTRAPCDPGRGQPRGLKVPGSAPDRRSSLRPARPGPRSPRRFSLSRSRVGTMSAETASGPTEDQVEILEYNFNKVNKHPDPTTLCLIAAEAGLSEEETQVSPRARPTPARGDPPRPPSPGRSREGWGSPLPSAPAWPPSPGSFVASARTPGAQTCIAPTAASQLPGSTGARSVPPPQPGGSRGSCLEAPRPPSLLLAFPLSPTARDKRSLLPLGWEQRPLAHFCLAFPGLFSPLGWKRNL